MGYPEVAAAYDAFAPEYDEWVGEHPSGRRAKGALLSRVRRLARPGARLLDVGCGTGSEAVALAKAGYHVTGVDIAPRMLDIAREKARAAGVDVALLQGAAGEADARWGGGFDLAYSAYGVVNLEEDPLAATRAIAGRVRPGGHVLVGTLNPTALFELALWPAVLHLKGFRKAAAERVFLRLGHGREEGAVCRLPPNRAFARIPGLTLVEEVGLHVFAPPPNEAMLRRFPRFVGALNRVEARLGQRPPFARLGYFSLLTLRKEGAASAEADRDEV